MRAAASHLIAAGRTENLRPLVERFRGKSDFGVWARMTSSNLHRAAGSMRPRSPTLTISWPAFLTAPARIGGSPRRVAWKGSTAAKRLRRRSAKAPTASLMSPLPRVFLANLLSRLLRAGEALEVWRDAHARYAEPELSWFAGLSNALRAVGRREEALRALEDGARRFPDDPGAPPMLAEVAEAREQWGRALEIWENYTERFEKADPRAVVGRARALFRLDRIDEAFALLDDIARA